MTYVDSNNIRCRWMVTVSLAGTADADVDDAVRLITDTPGIRSSAVRSVDGSIHASLLIDATSAIAAAVLVDDVLLDVVGRQWTPVAVYSESAAAHDRDI